VGHPASDIRVRRLLPVVAVWCLLLAGVLAWPWLGHATDPGDDLIRNTIRLSLLFYALAFNLMLWLRRDDWPTDAGQLTRACWTVAWFTYLVHLAMAFHFYHHWSHADAVRHTQEVSNFGAGIYVSHLFTLAWTVDLAWWWLGPASRAARSPWIDRLLHGFMLFMVFCGTIVYETGFIRWAGVLLFAELAVMALYARFATFRQIRTFPQD
jgi:hypothetical protein